jgi:hypothetical protein
VYEHSGITRNSCASSASPDSGTLPYMMEIEGPVLISRGQLRDLLDQFQLAGPVPIQSGTHLGPYEIASNEDRIAMRQRTVSGYC